MKKGLWIYLIVLIALAVFIDYSILKPKSLPPAPAQSFTLSRDRYAIVSGDIDAVEVTTASSYGYYRIRSGNSILEGKHVTGNHFLDNSELQIGKWMVEDGDAISITAVSPVSMSVLMYSTSDLYITTIIFTILLSSLFFIFGMALVNIS